MFLGDMMLLGIIYFFINTWLGYKVFSDAESRKRLDMNIQFAGSWGWFVITIFFGIFGVLTYFVVNNERKKAL